MQSELQKTRTSLNYQPGELLYGGLALAAFKKGWTLLPQERNDRRITSRIDGRALRWGAYIDEMPHEKEVAYWALQAPRANGAILMGRPSGNVFCFDIDVLDKELSYAVQELAFKILGKTRFMRQGQAPKQAMFYRVEKDEDLPRNAVWRFLNEDGPGISGDMLEVQARGKLITGYGYHHKTDKYFVWSGPQPVTHGPESVPLVTPEKIDEFIEAVQDIRPFHRNNVGPIDVEYTSPDGTLRVPKLSNKNGAAQWVEENGLVVDGREAFLWHLVSSTMRANPSFAGSGEGQAKIRGQVLESFEHSAKMSGKWTQAYLRREVNDKVWRACRDLTEGRMQPIRFAQTVKAELSDEYRFPTIRSNSKQMQLAAEYETISDEDRARRVL